MNTSTEARNTYVHWPRRCEACTVAHRKAREAILAHAARIESGELTWVPRPPGRGECCVGYVIPGDGSIRWVGQDVSFDVAHAVHNALDAEAQFRGAARFVEWNDEYCRDAAEAVEFLRAAARRCYP